MTVKNHTCYCRHLIEMWWQIHIPSAFVDDVNLDTYNIRVRAGLKAFPEEAVEKKVLMTGCESTMGVIQSADINWPIMATEGICYQHDKQCTMTQRYAILP